MACRGSDPMAARRIRSCRACRTARNSGRRTRPRSASRLSQWSRAWHRSAPPPAGPGWRANAPPRVQRPRPRLRMLIEGKPAHATPLLALIGRAPYRSAAGIPVPVASPTAAQRGRASPILSRCSAGNVGCEATVGGILSAGRVFHLTGCRPRATFPIR
jgi:hypothetical protein